MGILPYVLFYILLIVYLFGALGGAEGNNYWTNINWVSALYQELCWPLGIEQWGRGKDMNCPSQDEYAVL